MNLKQEAWKVFGGWIKRRDSDWRGYGKCFTCGKLLKVPSSEAHAGHFVHGSTKKTYFCEFNVHLQCRSCNFFKDGARDMYALKLIQKYGDGIIQKIHDINKDKSTWKAKELKEIIEKYSVDNSINN